MGKREHKHGEGYRWIADGQHQVVAHGSLQERDKQVQPAPPGLGYSNDALFSRDPSHSDKIKRRHCALSQYRLSM